MSVYSINVSNVAVVLAVDIMTMTPASARSIQVIEVSVGGMGTASTAQEVGIFNVTTNGVTASGALTPAKFNPNAPAAAGTYGTTWTTAPVVGTQLLSIPVNSNGGLYRWVARPGEEITAIGAFGPPGGQLSFKGKVGTTNISAHIIFIEDPL